MENYLKDLIEDEDTRKELPSYKIYEKFKNIIHMVNSTIFHKLYQNSENDEKTYINKVSDFCSIFSWNLENLSEITDKKLKYRDECSYLSYWAYEEIKSIFGTLDNYNKKRHIINKLNKIVSDISNRASTKKPCYIYFGNEFDKWDEWKQLHDYFKNSEHILSLVTESNCSECTKFCNYVKHIKTLYDKYERGCCLWGSCDDYINCDDKYNPNELLKRLKCEEEGSEQRTSEEGQSSTPESGKNNMRINYLKCYTSYIDKKKDTTTDTEKNEESDSRIAQCYYVIPRGKNVREPMDITVPGKGANSKRRLSVLWTVPFSEEVYKDYEDKSGEKRLVHISKEFEEVTCSMDASGKIVPESCKQKKEVKATVNVEKHRPDIPNIENGISIWDNLPFSRSVDNPCNSILCDPTRIAMLGILTLGVFFVLFIYYKFTPCGDWIRWKFGKKKRMQYDYPAEGAQIFEQRATNSYKKGPPNKRIQIAYHPDAQRRR
ncbi:PIR protein [Plasmodium vivax]|nr:PIR protein [Plasmodium vivax]